MYAHKLHRVGSLAVHSPYLYCEERKAFIDHYFDRGQSRGHGINIESMVMFIKRQYLAKYGQDDYYEQLEQTICRKFARRKEREPDIKDDVFQWAFKVSKEQFKVRTPQGKQSQFEFIKDCLIDVFGETTDLDDYIRKSIKREVKNLCNRLKRAKRKGELNHFNYFVTFTYDDNLHSSDSFGRKLKTVLKNMAYRRGWAYMIIKEQGGETERTHFHSLLYIPAGQMVGDLVNVEKFCPIKKRMKKWIQNTWFEKNFGINTFEEITYAQGSMLPINYIQKYMSKTDERIKYSRHLPAYDIKELPDDTVKIDLTYEDGTQQGYIISDFYLPKNHPGRKITPDPDKIE